jgi:glutathione S-transferase
MKLYDVKASLNCRKVRVLARELGLALELVPMDLQAPRDPSYLALNPNGKVPTLIDDDGLTLWESGAMLIHLAEKKPHAGLFPTEPHARASVLRWMFFAATHLQPWVSILGVERLIKPRTGQTSDPAAIALAERELARFLPVLDAWLGEHEYLEADYSIADIALGCGFENAEQRGVDFTKYPNVVRWRALLRGRPAWSE